MDNRIDQIEDLQATAQHPAGRVPGMPTDPFAPGLTAGPHNNVPPSPGAGDSAHVVNTFEPWREREAKDAPSNTSFISTRSSSRWEAFRRDLPGRALPLLIGAAGLGLVLFALQRGRLR